MVRIINIACPHCEKQSEIYLSIDPNVIILNCPECGTPLILEDSGVKEVSRELDIHKPSIKDILDAFKSRNQEDTEKIETSKEFFEETTPFELTSGMYENSKNYPPAEQISEDDIMNLRIDLARSFDVEEVIQNL